jgi:hypothetical protein
MHNHNASIDIYCERIGPDLWSEPVNALTNLAFVLAAALPPDFLNGSVFYLPSWTALVAITLWLVGRRHPSRGLFAGATTLFLVSLGFRTADMAVCAVWPLGTHFLWHLLNALLLWLLVRGVMDTPAVQSARTG